MSQQYIGMNRRPWINDRIDQLGITQSDVADALGLPQSRIADMVSGKRSIKVDEIDGFAKSMMMAVPEVLRMFSPQKKLDLDASEPQFETMVVKIVGQVMAGCLMDADNEYEDPEGFIPVSSAALPGNKNYFALRVRGDSMDKLFDEGDVLICIPVEEYDKDLTSGIPVVVDRAENGRVESTVKEYEVRQDGAIYLWPRSNNPDHQSPLRFERVPEKYDDGGLAPVSIRAVVVWAMKRYS